MPTFWFVTNQFTNLLALFNMEHNKCKINDIRKKEDNKLQPILVSFPHGSLSQNEASSLKCTVCRNISSKKRHIAVATKDDSIYIGSGDELEGSCPSNVCNTFIAIRNCKTNKVRLIECDNILLSRFATKQQSFAINGMDGEKVSVNDSYSKLFKSFGSKVKQRRTDQQERYRTNVKTLEENLTNIVNTVEIESFSDQPVTNVSILPKCNRLASSVNGVYELHDLISKVELDSLESEATNILSDTTSLKTDDHTPFFIQNLMQVNECKNGIQALKVLLYADCLLRFFRTVFKGTNESMKNVCPYSQVIADKIKREFTLESNSRKRLRPISMHEKAVSHVIVLGLLIFNFKLNLKTIADTSRMSMKRLTILSKALGATIDQGTVAVLKLPLADPPNLPVGKNAAQKNRK